MAYRASLHTVTGFSPYFLNHGREARLPTELLYSEIEDRDQSEEDYIQELIARLREVFNQTEANIVSNKKNSKWYYDKNSTLKVFHPGEFLLLLDTTVKRGRSKKLKQPWTGPYKVIEKVSDINYCIQKSRK